MAPKLPFMPFYGADFFADEKVQLMSGQEVASYLRLLWHQWREGSVPGNPEDCSAIARAAHDPERVLACFPVGADGRRRNPRLESIRAEQESVRQKQSQGGKLGRARQLAQGEPGDTPERAQGEPGVGLGSTESDTETETETTKSIAAVAAVHSNGSRPPASQREDEQAVVEHYRSLHPKRLRGDLPPKTARLLRNALKTYSVDELCRAIDHNAASQFHREGNFMGLDLILRDSEKIDFFIDLKPPPVPDDGIRDEPVIEWVNG